jgi:hypothetical protein
LSCSFHVSYNSRIGFVFAVGKNQDRFNPTDSESCAAFPDPVMMPVSAAHIRANAVTAATMGKAFGTGCISRTHLLLKAFPDNVTDIKNKNSGRTAMLPYRMSNGL